MITYQDCPNCGARKIHSTVRVCEVCETWERAKEELEKLRKDVSRLQKMLDVCSSVHEHNVKLVSERDELRAEVERLQSWTPIGTYSLDVQHEEERRRLTMERDEARAALELASRREL